MTHVAELTGGFSGPRAADIAGITYRQLDYWARIDLVRPSLHDAVCSGDRRRYSPDDVRLLALLRHVEMRQRRSVVDAVRSSGGACRRFVIDPSAGTVSCCVTDQDVVAAVKASRFVTLVDLDALRIPELDDATASV